MTTTDPAAQKWNDRYKDNAFAYGKEPNVFFKTRLDQYAPGTILMPADGEGRNGVYAALQGWNVTSFDLSAEGKTKALQLAHEKGVTLTYNVGSFEHLHIAPAGFDAVGLIYAHVDADQKSEFHKLVDTALRPGGIIIFEAFSKHHLPYVTSNPAIGGPKDINALYTTGELQMAFAHYDIILLTEETIALNEGRYHIGKGAVVRFVARKRE